MTKASDNAFPSILITEGTEPSAPAAGKQRLYIDSTTHVLMLTNSSGTESVVGGSLPAWTNYTPTWTAATTNPTLGSTTITGRYRQFDSKTYLVKISIAITTGGAWNAGSGEYRFSPPTGTISGQWVGAAQILDAGTKRYGGSVIAENGNTYIGPVALPDVGAPSTLSHNAPVTWATGDKIDFQIILEIA